jgi:acyl transferase domain-containing protein
VVLKRLSDALADQDRILALIRGSSINHDGPSSGLTVPNGLAQQAVIRAALEHSGIKPAEVIMLKLTAQALPLRPDRGKHYQRC